MKKITLMALALAFLTVSSCKKEETKSETKSKTELLTAKAWKITAQTINPGVVVSPGLPAVTDLFALYVPCQQDDTE
jgi:hypothetical protein